MTLLATLVADKRGVINAWHQTTYCGDIIPRNRKGDLMIEELTDDEFSDRRHAYEILCIRLTGGFA